MTPSQLFQARKKGLRPDGLVILTLVPELSQYFECIDVTNDQETQGLTDLDILLIFHSSQASQTIDLTARIAKATPWQLELWEVDSGKWQCVITGHEVWCKHCPPKGPFMDRTQELKNAFD